MTDETRLTLEKLLDQLLARFKETVNGENYVVFPPNYECGKATGLGFAVNRIRSLLEFGETYYYAKCSVCGKGTDPGGGAWDEGHIWSCTSCIAAWEHEHKAHWATGQPFASKA